MTGPKRPVLFDDEDLGPPAPGPAEAPPIRDDDAPPEGRAMVRMARIAGRRPSAFGRLVRWSLAALIGMAVSLAAWDLVEALLARNVWLGRTAMALAAIVALGALAFVLGEIAAIVRLSRLDRLQARARDAVAGADLPAAQAVARDLAALYHPREELRLAVQTLERQRAETLDADAVVAAAERTLMAPLDAAARAEIEAAARQVAGVTALVPLALADVAAAMVANTRMIRRIAVIYGGRAGTFGSLRLLRAVAAHLIATGAVAVGDDLISSVAGGGALAKVSRRFGEGVVNGALTARVGIAAMEVCRPLPFAALPRPKVSNLIGRALTGMFQGDR